MRTHLKTTAIILALGMTGFIQPAGAQTQPQGTAQSERAAQEAACGGDASRLCGPALPDEQKIAACLRANQDKISPACRAMLR